MADDDVFSGSPENLARLADKIRQWGNLMGVIEGNMSNKISSYPDLNGNNSDDISKMLTSKIGPAMKGSLEFLKNLKVLSEGHGGTLFDVSNLLKDMNQSSTNEANGHGGRR